MKDFQIKIWRLTLPSPKERVLTSLFFKVVSFGEDLGEALPRAG
jgi:hypothetical protein